MKKILKNGLEDAFNRTLALDPESAIRLKKLKTKVVQIELTGINLFFQLIFTESGIELQPENFSKPDTVIKSAPMSLLAMAFARKNRQAFFKNAVCIEGDLDLAQQVMDLLDKLDIDWEEFISKWIGDVSAHQVGRVFRGFKKWNGDTHEAMLKNINEYVHEEINFFPSREALQDFFDEVDVLRMDVDRLSVRIENLIAKSHAS